MGQRRHGTNLITVAGTLQEVADGLSEEFGQSVVVDQALAAHPVNAALPYSLPESVEILARLVGGVVKKEDEGGFSIREKKAVTLVLPNQGMTPEEVGLVFHGTGRIVGDSVIAKVDPEEVEAIQQTSEAMSRRPLAIVQVELVARLESSNAIPWRDSFEPTVTGFAGVSSTNLATRGISSLLGGVSVNVSRAQVGGSGRVLWRQVGVMLSGGNARLESGTIAARDLSTVVPGQNGSATSFTTAVERRTIGVTLVLSAVASSNQWYVNLELEASTDKTGAERVVRVKSRPRINQSAWADVAELTREDGDTVVKALPGKGLWKSVKKATSSERYFLRVRVDSRKSGEFGLAETSKP